MLTVSQNGDIRLTRGDTARLTVDIQLDHSGKPYQMAEDDTLTLTVKKDTKEANALLSKKVEGSNRVHIKPEDTAEHPFGTYVYDVQLTTRDGDVYTLLGPCVFELLPEVTW